MRLGPLWRPRPSAVASESIKLVAVTAIAARSFVTLVDSMDGGFDDGDSPAPHPATASATDEANNHGRMGKGTTPQFNPPNGMRQAFESRNKLRLGIPRKAYETLPRAPCARRTGDAPATPRPLASARSKTCPTHAPEGRAMSTADRQAIRAGPRTQTVPARVPSPICRSPSRTALPSAAQSASTARSPIAAAAFTGTSCLPIFTFEQLGSVFGRMERNDPSSERALIDQLIADTQLYATSDALKELFEFVAKLKNVAPFNAMLLHAQKPGISHVMTQHDWWNRFQRRPKKEARPLVIPAQFRPGGLRV